MYFVLDRDDIIYDSNNDALYRLVAKERFETLDPDDNGMFRKTKTIYPGDRGGYVGSNYCLEEKIGLQVKPWAFFCSTISIGSILSGASVISGNSNLCNNALVEGANVLKNTVVDGSTISSKEYYMDSQHMLISGYFDKNSEIINSKIRGRCVQCHAASLYGCVINQEQSEIVLINSDLHDLEIEGNVRVKDTSLLTSFSSQTGRNNYGNKTKLAHGSFYESGSLKDENPMSIMVKRRNAEIPYMMVYEDMQNRDEKEKEVRGVYRHVDYNPAETCKA